MLRVLPTGCSSLDEKLEGGLLEGSLVLVYGEAETGKTTLAMQIAVNCARIGYKTIFIDCDGSFSPKRMVQIAAEDFEELAPQVILMRPENFEQQTVIVDRLNEYISQKVGLVVIDTITGLYREKLGDNMKEAFSLNRELNRQMACLAQITKTQRLTTIVISQVQSVVSKEYEMVQPVATRVLKFWADTIITLKPTVKAPVIKAILETHKDRKSSKPIFLEIAERGLRDHGG